MHPDDAPPREGHAMSAQESPRRLGRALELPTFAKSGTVVGIDLGTTYSGVAWVNPTGQLEVIPNSDGEFATPSVVFFEGNTALVGREAAKAALMEPDKSADCFKRDMGHAEYRRWVCGRRLRPEFLSALVLRKLKQDAERRIGPIAEAVITVPAYFDDLRRKATQDAGHIAGLNVRAIINEPTAAAFSRVYEHGAEGLRDNLTMLVYDLGGGTFDATLMRYLGQNEFATVATDGDVMLGGKDWDERLIDYVAEEFIRATGADPRQDELSHQDLVIRVEEAKRTLSKRTSVTLPVSHAGRRVNVTVSRDTFKALTADLLMRTQMTVELLLAEAKLKWKQVDEILPVGGSSRMPMVSEMLRALSGREPRLLSDLELAVARGAALYAESLRARDAGGAAGPHESELTRRLRTLKHRTVNAHSLGVEVLDARTGEMENCILIPKNSAIPTQASQRFATSEPTHAGGMNLKVRALEGEAPDPRACMELGLCCVENLPPGLPAGSPVVVTFSYTEEGRVDVTAFVEAIQRSATVTLLRRELLDPRGVEAAIAELARFTVE